MQITFLIASSLVTLTLADNPTTGALDTVKMVSGETVRFEIVGKEILTSITLSLFFSHAIKIRAGINRKNDFNMNLVRVFKF
ncbi:MAG TPA: hypothetical protein PLG90_10950 [Ignavibacteria bacterium]|nr:hypothetical protein [Ignavibacteria bacterium]